MDWGLPSCLRRKLPRVRLVTGWPALSSDDGGDGDELGGDFEGGGFGREGVGAGAGAGDLAGVCAKAGDENGEENERE